MFAEIATVINTLAGLKRRDPAGLSASEISDIKEHLGAEQVAVLDAFLESFRNENALTKHLLDRDFLKRQFGDWVDKRVRFNSRDLEGKSILKVSESAVRVCRLLAGGGISEWAPFDDGPAWDVGEWSVNDGVLRLRVGRDPVWDLCVVGDPSGIHIGFEGTVRMAIGVCGRPQRRHRFMKVTDAPNVRHLTLHKRGVAEEKDPFDSSKKWLGSWNLQEEALRLEMNADRVYSGTFSQGPEPWAWSGTECGLATKSSEHDYRNDVRFIAV